MMHYRSEFHRLTDFKKWLGTFLPSCNDNNDPDHDRSVSAADPHGKTEAGTITINCNLRYGG
jgi:hypothetical protein